MSKHKTKNKRSTPRSMIKNLPIYIPVYVPKSNELILSDMGYNSKDFLLTNKTTNNLSFTQISTGLTLDIRI